MQVNGGSKCETPVVISFLVFPPKMLVRSGPFFLLIITMDLYCSKNILVDAVKRHVYTDKTVFVGIVNNYVHRVFCTILVSFRSEAIILTHLTRLLRFLYLLLNWIGI